MGEQKTHTRNATIGVLVDAAGSGYRTPGGLRKFVDTLPGLGPGAANNLGQYISVAHPDTNTYHARDCRPERQPVHAAQQLRESTWRGSELHDNGDVCAVATL